MIPDTDSGPTTATGPETGSRTAFGWPLLFASLAAAVALCWTLLPVYWLLRMALLIPAEISSYPPPILPHHPQPGNFLNIVGFDYRTAEGLLLKASGQSRQIVNGLINSLIVATATTIITLVIVVPLAYLFGRMEFRFKTGLFMAVLFAVAVPPVSTLIPFYSLFSDLGLTGTRTGLVLITLTTTVPFVTWMLIGYFRNIPPVERLAAIDGLTRLGTLLRIVIPLARSGITVAAVISFLFSWNEYVFATTLVNGTDATTLPAAASGFLFQQPQPGHMAAAMCLSMLPAALVVFFLQRHITEMNLVDPVR
jgi:multiple sugar transport system permease protein